MIGSITRSTPYSTLPQSRARTENADQSFGEILTEMTTEEDDLLKNAPEKWVTGPGFSELEAEKVLEFRRRTLELEDPKEYTYELTAEQEAWLLSRHDLSNIQRYVPYTWVSNDGTTHQGVQNSAEYCNFVLDLVYLGYCSKSDLIQTEPIDTRPGGYSTVYEYYLARKNSDGSLFESSRSIVDRLEEMYRYYYERSQDKSRAVKGDAEFAALIKEHYMPFEKEFFAFIDRLLGKDKEQLPQRTAAPIIEDISEKLKEDFGKAFA